MIADSQLECLTHNVRVFGSTFKTTGLLSGVFSLTAVFPWMLGTFRTLDLSKWCGETGLGFNMYIGSAALVLAVIGSFQRSVSEERRPVRRTALWLVCLFLGVASSKLLAFFYVRLAGLAVLGLVVLAALGLEYLWQRTEKWPRYGWTILGLTGALVLALQVFSFVVFPKVQPRVDAMLKRKLAAERQFLDSAPALRKFQLNNLPNEISFKNPETVLAALSLLALGWLCLSPAVRRQPWAWGFLLALNFAPELMFYRRFIPNQRIELWQRLLAGGPEQNKLRELLADKPLRLYEKFPGVHEMAVPQNWAHIYHIRTVNGYSSLEPRSLVMLPEAEKNRYRQQLADFIYESRERGQSAGVLLTNATPGTVVFQWLTPINRAFQVELASLCEIRLKFSDGPAGALLWTDTHYPGWQAQAGPTRLAVQPSLPCFSRLEIPAGAVTVTLRYRPTYLGLSRWIVLFGIISSLGMCLLVHARHRKHCQDEPLATNTTNDRDSRHIGLLS